RRDLQKTEPSKVPAWRGAPPTSLRRGSAARAAPAERSENADLSTESAFSSRARGKLPRRGSLEGGAAIRSHAGTCREWHDACRTSDAAIPKTAGPKSTIPERLLRARSAFRSRGFFRGWRAHKGDEP